MARRRRSPPRSAAPADRPGRTAAALFVLALLLRLLYWQATPDRGWAYAAALKGDAARWLDYAAALRQGLPFELGLPLHPPGTAYLLAALLGAGAGTLALRAIWCALGATTVAIAYLAARRCCGSRPALIAGLLLAGSHALLVLSSSLDSETPYLLLIAVSFLLLDQLRGGAPARLALWALLQAIACLFRVEHALFALLCWGWLLVVWRRRGDRPRALATRSALAAAIGLLALLPWQLGAWRAAARLDELEPPTSAAEAAALAGIERRTAHLVWEDGARRRRAELPAFARRPASLFVAATVARRGGATVTEADFAILDEAFGSTPRPLGRRFFVSLYGPLNFALANHGAATGGFTTLPLERAPPLEGGAFRYPPELIGGLPPPQLSLVYPPHLALVTDGWAIGGRWIGEHPRAFLRLAGRKLRIFWSGAALGLTGYDLPLGASGIRRAVDLTAPRPSPLAIAWQLTVVGLVTAGAWRARRSWAALGPWLLFLASRVVVAVLFFGYARQGALVVPVVALLAALALTGPPRDQETPPAPRWRWLPAACGLALLAIELGRCLAPPVVALDGRPIGAADPFPADLHRDQIYTAK